MARKTHRGLLYRYYYRCRFKLVKNDRKEDEPFLLLYHQKAPHRNWKPAQKYLTLYDDVTFDPPANFFDDYEGRGTAAKTQEMEIDGHARWGHDFKFQFDPTNGDTTWLVNQLKRLNPEQLADWLAAYEPKTKPCVRQISVVRNWPCGNTTDILRITLGQSNLLMMELVNYWIT